MTEEPLRFSDGRLKYRKRKISSLENSYSTARPQFQPSPGKRIQSSPKRPVFVERDVDLEASATHNAVSEEPGSVERTETKLIEVSNVSVGLASDTPAPGDAKVPRDLDEDSIGMPDFIENQEKRGQISLENVSRGMSPNTLENVTQQARSDSPPMNNRNVYVQDAEIEVYENIEETKDANGRSLIICNTQDLNDSLGKNRDSAPLESTPCEAAEIPSEVTPETVANVPSVSYLSPDPEGNSVSRHPESTVPSEWLASQKCLINYLESAHNLQALSLHDFLTVQTAETGVHDGDLQYSENILNESLLYVVAPRATHAVNPSKMPKSHLALCSSSCSTEEFLTKLWTKLRSRKEMSSLNNELHAGPWYYLCNRIGRTLVAYLLLHHHIFKPWKPLHGPGMWLHLTGTLKYDKNGERNYGARTDANDAHKYLTKADIMYKSRRPSYKFRFPKLGFEEKDSFPPSLWNLMLISEKRLTQYSVRVAKGGITRSLHPPSSRKFDWTPHKEVVQFISHRMEKIIPYSLIGSKQNRKSLDRAIAEFVKAPGFSKVSVKLLMKGIKHSEVPWIKSMQTTEQEKRISMEKCLHWLFDWVIKPLLKYHFYLTEISGKPGSIYYFEQTIWHRKFERPAVRQIAQKELVSYREHETDRNAHGNAHNSDKNVLASRAESWRIVPKSDGSSRPIINLKELNREIRAAHLVLQNTIVPHDTQVSSWHNWLMRLYQYRDEMVSKHPSTPTFYMVKLDIVGCYENANVDKVKELVQNTLDEGRKAYRMQTTRQFDIHCDKYRVRDTVVSLPERQTCETVYGKKDALFKNPRASASIVSETPNYRLIQGNAILKDIIGLFDSLKIKLSRGRSIPFMRGIPQGSICSLDLCNMLLDDLIDDKLKDFTSDPDSMLLRYVDDFLFVSTNRSLAERFCEMMLTGFKAEYGVMCNPDKLISTVGQGNRPKKVPFLGMTIDAETLDIYPRSIPRTFKPKSPSIQNMKKKIDYELETMLGPLRSFHRSGKIPSVKLMNDTALQFGVALVSRLEFFALIYSQKGIVKLADVYQRVVNRYFLRLVPPEARANLRSIIRQSYRRQRKSQLRKIA